MIKNTTKGKAKDEILKYCLKNKSFIPYTDLAKKLFPETDKKLVNLLLKEFDLHFEKVADTMENGRTMFISSNERTAHFLENGGFTKIEKDEINRVKKKSEKEQVEFEKSKVDLELAKKTLEEFPKTKWFARIGFIIGVVLMLKELYILLWK